MQPTSSTYVIILGFVISFCLISLIQSFVFQYARSDAEVAIVGNKADLPKVKVSSSKARHVS